MLKNKKLLYILISVLALILLIFFSVSYYKSKVIPEDTYKKISSIALENELVSKTQVNNCESTDYCISYVVEYSLENQKEKALSLGTNVNAAEKDNLIELAKRKKYKTLTKKYQIFVEEHTKKIRSFTNSDLTSRDIRNIVSKASLIKVTGDQYRIGYYLQEREFLLVNIKPNEEVTDSANLVFKKKDNNWNLILGPGTSFDPEDIIKHKLPDKIAKSLQNININTEQINNYPPQDNSKVDPYLE